MERRAAVNGSVAADKGVLHGLALDIVRLDRTASVRSLLGKRPGRLGIAVHFIGLVGGHALTGGSGLAVARQDEFPLAWRHPVGGAQGRGGDEEDAAKRGEQNGPSEHGLIFHASSIARIGMTPV